MAKTVFAMITLLEDGAFGGRPIRACQGTKDLVIRVMTGQSTIQATLTTVCPAGRFTPVIVLRAALAGIQTTACRGRLTAQTRACRSLLASTRHRSRRTSRNRWSSSGICRDRRSGTVR